MLLTGCGMSRQDSISDRGKIFFFTVKPRIVLRFPVGIRNSFTVSKTAGA
jgi:hypothetical protein